MDEQRYQARERARALAKSSLDRGDALGWFEDFYREAAGDTSRIPWADRQGHPLLVEWLASSGADLRGKRALVVGCGLGEDAEELARAGANVCAFDLSATAVEWCRRLWPQSRVDYSVANLLAAPAAWTGAFDFVLEIYTLQALPRELLQPAALAITSFLAPRGELLVISRARQASESLTDIPWPLAREELDGFSLLGLRTLAIEDLASAGDPPTRHWRGRFAR